MYDKFAKIFENFLLTKKFYLQKKMPKPKKQKWIPVDIKEILDIRQPLPDYDTNSIFFCQCDNPHRILYQNEIHCVYCMKKIEISCQNDHEKRCHESEKNKLFSQWKEKKIK